MKSMEHEKQHQIWEKEHDTPQVLHQMDSRDVSSGVAKFVDWIGTVTNQNDLTGIEMCCGKGRNVIGLARQGFDMTGFDFSKSAITEARKRALEAGIEPHAQFFIQDATKAWQFPSDKFDFGIDCFASTDIESTEGREFARNEFIRVIKPGGYLLVYTLSTDDEFHKEMVKVSPAKEKNAFFHPTTGKFEKTFERDELVSFYKDLKLVQEERVKKKATFFGKEYDCKHFWMVFQKT